MTTDTTRLIPIAIGHLNNSAGLKILSLSLYMCMVFLTWIFCSQFLKKFIVTIKKNLPITCKGTSVFSNISILSKINDKKDNKQSSLYEFKTTLYYLINVYVYIQQIMLK